MVMTSGTTASAGPSLEALVEGGLVHLESLHPGGLEMARELAELWRIDAGSKVLDVAAGTGETACYLAEQFGAVSAEMIRRGKSKAQAKGLAIESRTADASRLQFPEATFDAVICECTLCLLDKQQVIAEMARVARPGGSVGMHDLCWCPLREAPCERFRGRRD
jgi:ubiquinone/menaquinone biosynthesis C-methylase UbiE